MNNTSHKGSILIALILSLIHMHRRNKRMKNIERVNESNKCIFDLRDVTTDSLLPFGQNSRKLLVSGNNTDARNELVIQNCKQSMDNSIPTIVIHEHNMPLQSELNRIFLNYNNVRIVDQYHPFYDPVHGIKDDNAVADLIMNTYSHNNSDPLLALYIKSLISILKHKNIYPSIKLFENCPYDSILTIISELEKNGQITNNDATALRNTVNLSVQTRPVLEYLFSKLKLEEKIFPNFNQLSRSTSILSCIQNNGLLVIDIESVVKETQLSLIASEIEYCKSLGYQFRVILDINTISSEQKIIQVLISPLGNMDWTLSTSDVTKIKDNKNSNNLLSLLELSDLSIIFKHSLKASQEISKEFGEFDKLEVLQSSADNNGIGAFGYHFGSNDNISVSNKRASIIQPEEIERLKDNEFFLLNNTSTSIYRGTLIL